MQTTVNMGLIKWNEYEDPYDHVQLSTNFQTIDDHDHTEGKGKRLNGSALEDESIDTPQLKDKSVTNDKLAGNITSDKLAPGTLGELGEVILWWRPNASTSLPSDVWEICAGQTLSSSEHDFVGGGSITLPNMIGRMPRGVELPQIGTYGGNASISLSHTHTVNDHTHSVPQHGHPIGLESGFNYATNLKISQDLSGSSWVHADDHSGAEHRHSINGEVGIQGPWTSGGSTPGTSSALGSSSIIPPYFGLIYLVRVRN